MCVVNLDKAPNAVVFRLLCPDIKVLHVSQDSPDDTRAEVIIGLFAAFLQGNSAIRTATATSCSPDGGQGADLVIFPGI